MVEVRQEEQQAQAVLEKAKEVAQQAADIVSRTSAQLEGLEWRSSGLGQEYLRESSGAVSPGRKNFWEDLKDFIQEHPLWAAGGAAAFGYMLADLLGLGRGQRAAAPPEALAPAARSLADLSTTIFRNWIKRLDPSLLAEEPKEAHSLVRLHFDSTIPEAERLEFLRDLKQAISAAGGSVRLFKPDQEVA